MIAKRVGRATILIAGFLILFSPSQQASGEAADEWARLDPISIDESIGETFTPVDATTEQVADQGYLSDLAAYRRVTGDPEALLPAKTRVQIGRLKLPSGPDSSSMIIDDVLVYALVDHSCQPTVGPMPAPGTEKEDPSTVELKCTHWMFLDAKTGENIDGIWTR